MLPNTELCYNITYVIQAALVLQKRSKKTTFLTNKLINNTFIYGIYNLSMEGKAVLFFSLFNQTVSMLSLAWRTMEIDSLLELTLVVSRGTGLCQNSKPDVAP